MGASSMWYEILGLIFGLGVSGPSDSASVGVTREDGRKCGGKEDFGVVHWSAIFILCANMQENANKLSLF